MDSRFPKNRRATGEERKLIRGLTALEPPLNWYLHETRPLNCLLNPGIKTVFLLCSTDSLLAYQRYGSCRPRSFNTADTKSTIGYDSKVHPPTLPRLYSPTLLRLVLMMYTPLDFSVFQMNFSSKFTQNAVCMRCLLVLATHPLSLSKLQTVAKRQVYCKLLLRMRADSYTYLQWTIVVQTSASVVQENRVRSSKTYICPVYCSCMKCDVLFPFCFWISASASHAPRYYSSDMIYLFLFVLKTLCFLLILNCAFVDSDVVWLKHDAVICVDIIVWIRMKLSWKL